MKKVLSIILIFALLASVPLALGGCGTPAQGTEAAKLLLAHDRMDEAAVGAKIDFFTSGAVNPANVLTVNAPNTLYSSLSALNTSFSARAADYTWSADKFLNHSHSMVEFTQFMDNIEDGALKAAEAIGKMKKDVGITDKWIDFGWFTEYDYMLRVFESEDILFIRGDTLFRVYKRYTSEDAKSVYELYTYIKYDNGESGEIRELFIPGERYEYMFIPSAENSSGDYFIAENSRGYWIATRYGLNREGYASFSPLIIKDGLGYGAHISIDPGSAPKVVWYDVYDPLAERELLRVQVDDDSTTVELYISGIKNGFVSVGAISDEIYPYEGDILQAHHISEITTSKGTYAVQPDGSEGVYLSDGYVQYLGYAGTYPATHYGSIGFTYEYPRTDAVNVREVLDRFEDYFTEIGLTTYCDMDAVARSVMGARAYAEEFGSLFTWNGYYMSSAENAAAAERILIEDFARHRAMYEEIKDNEYASGKQYLSSSEFSQFDALVGTENRYSNGTITVGALAATLSDPTYLEQGIAYVLRLGLTLTDAQGNPISANTVPLPLGNAAAVTYNGEPLSLSLSGDFALPKNLDSGKYAVVAYIATAEDGIRVTELRKIAFLDVDEGTLASAAMDITVEKSGEHMFVVYAIKNSVRFTETAEKESYTYREVERKLMLAVLEKGYPHSEAALEYEDGTPVTEDASLGLGTYRLKGYINTEDGLAESYIYLTLV